MPHDAPALQAAYNKNDIDGVLAIMAEDCQYHDTIYLEPFVGKAAIRLRPVCRAACPAALPAAGPHGLHLCRGYFEKVSSIVPGDLQFHIENMSTGDPHSVGVKW